MFEHFTFGAQSQTQHQLLDDAFPSPTDTSFSSPLTPPLTSFPFHANPRQAGVNDIVTKLSLQSLQSRDQMVQQFQAWQYPSDLEVGDDDMDTPGERITQTVSVPSTPVLPPRGTVACRRLQRQLNVQLQTCSSHMRDINALVEDMIVSNSQCTLRKITSSQYLSSPPPSRGSDAADKLIVDPSEFNEGIKLDDMDEGFQEDEQWRINGEVEMSLRRASTPSGIRKYNNVKFGRSADVVAIGGKIKVRSIPRMRKRKVPRVPE